MLRVGLGGAKELTAAKRLPLLSKANPRGRARLSVKVICIPAGVYSEIEPLKSLQCFPQMRPLTKT